ncbi:MAG: hypothetical protein IPO78_03810 [Saprospiraceae bacterium]|nr:hypothetical protein [Saprospiraceae bacterium]MBK9720728.1 hypothetical protein [Saprospiraceae bacterium]
MPSILRKLARNPKTLFLVDGLGALLTAFFLFVILMPFNKYFGMPLDVLKYLAILAGMFCIYSFACFFFLSDNWHAFLFAISIANLLYCCLTISLVIYYYQRLTILSLTYFLVEVILVSGLIWLEIKVLRK